MRSPGGATGPARWGLAAIACGVTLLTVACSSSSTTASGGASSPPAAATTSSASNSALCADAAALRTSLGKLTQIQASAGQGVVNEVKSDLASAQAALTKFASDAKGHWQPQISALKSALASLQTAVQQLAANPSTAGVSTVVTALGQVTTAAQHLFAAVGKDCPSGT